MVGNRFREFWLQGFAILLLASGAAAEALDKSASAGAAVSYVGALAREAGLDRAECTAERQGIQDGLGYVALAFSAAGDYGAVERFVGRLLTTSGSQARLAEVERLRLKRAPAGLLDVQSSIRVYDDSARGASGARSAKGAAAARVRSARRDPLAILVSIASVFPMESVVVVEAAVGTDVRLRGFKLRPGRAALLGPVLAHAGMVVTAIETERDGFCDRFDVRGIPGRLSRPRKTDDADRNSALAAGLFRGEDGWCEAGAEPAAPRLIRRVTDRSGPGVVSLRLRDVEMAEAFDIVARLTAQGIVVDSDVAGRYDVEAIGVTAGELIEALEQGAGIQVTGSGSLRRVSRTGRPPAPSPLDAEGPPLSLRVTHGDLRDLLPVFQEVAGVPFAVAPDVAGLVSLSVTEVPAGEVLGTILDGSGLHARREAGGLTIDRRSDAPPPPTAPVRHPAAASAAARRARMWEAARREHGPGLRMDPPEVMDALDSEIAGVAHDGRQWSAVLRGARLLDGVTAGQYVTGEAKVDKVDGEGVTLRLNGGLLLRIPLPPVAERGAER